MTFVRHLRHVIVLAFVWLSLGLSAQADLSGDSDNVEVVLAIFGQGGSYVDVTTRVTSLLGGDNFAPSAQILNVSNSASTGNSLIILYNFNGGRHVFVRQDIAGKINSQLLKDEAALDGQKGSPYSFDAASGDDLKLLVVLYGIHASFTDITDVVVKAMQYSPAGFCSDSGVDFDPEYGASKSTIFVSNYGGIRVIYATQDKYTKVNRAFLKALAQAGQK
jgi:hypothetical protein